MLFEIALASGVLYFGASGLGIRSAARNAGRVFGRAAGSLRRVRAEVDRLQARAEAMGGAELSQNRAEIEARMQQLNAIRAEASALLSIHGSGGGSRDAASFTDAELAAALGVPAPAAPDASRANKALPIAPGSHGRANEHVAPPSRGGHGNINASRLIAELMASK